MYNLSFGLTKTEFYEKIWKCQVTDLLFFESSHQKVFSHNLLSKFQCVVVPYRISNVLYILLVRQLKCHFGLSKIPKQPHNYIRSTSLKKFSKEDHHWKEKRWPELSRCFTIVMWRLSNMAQFFVYYNSLPLPITLAGNRSQTNPFI